MKIRYGIIVLALLLCSAASASAQVSIGIGIGLPNVRIGINVPVFPELVPVPGYPVYYAPNLQANYFFYDGMYWVFENDNWYSSYWYDGPWYLVEPRVVPVFILRVPVRYYRYPPVYFRSWRADGPPRWGERWGRDWEVQRRGWDRWKRSAVPPRAPLPTYQRQYTGERYPQAEQQQRLHRDNYHYQPRDRAIRQQFKQRVEPQGGEPVRRERMEEPRMRGPAERDIRQQAPHQGPPQQREPMYREQREPAYREQRMQPGAMPQERMAPRQEQRFEERGRGQEPRGQGQGQRRDEERGGGRER